MRILWVKVGGLWPANTGGRLRSFHIISELACRHRVTLLTTHGLGDDVQALTERLSHCERVLSVPHAVPKHGSVGFALALLRSWISPLPVDLWKWRVPALKQQVRRLLAHGEFDLCVADFLVAAPNVPGETFVPVVFFAHNVEHVIWQRLCQVETRSWRRLLLNLERQKMRRVEAQMCARARLAIAVSPSDRDLLAANATGASVATISTGVDAQYFTPNGTREVPGRLVFTGSMGWYPNEDAILYFIDAILPAIRAEVQDVFLTVVGRDPSPRLRAAALRAGVKVTGTVEDVRPHVAEALVYVVPLRIGGGTRLKIFEALAMAKAVVSTTVGVEGLPLTPGHHFVQADDPVAFARAVVSLLRDPVRRRALGIAGRELVARRYSWTQVASEFEAHCAAVIGTDARPEHVGSTGKPAGQGDRDV
jgi:glycosyltransferase involved in cell wall biosynthesis